MSSFMFRICTLFLCVLAPWAVAAEDKSPFLFAVDSTFEVRQFKVDLHQCCFWGEYLTESQFTQVTRHGFEDYLQRAGVQVVEEGGNYALDVRVEYRRRFHGDGTPLPMQRMREPAFSFVLEAYSGDELAWSLPVDNKVLRNASVQNLEGDEEEWRDYFHGIILGGIMALHLVEEVAELPPVEALAFADYVPAIQAFKEQFATEQVPNVLYIPESVIDEYIARTESEDIGERTRAYMEIRTGWFNSERLFDALAEQIKRDAATQDKATIKAVREAMNALGSSGMMNYWGVFKTIDKMEGVDSAVQKQVKDSQRILRQRRAFNGMVHDTSTMDPEQSWIVNQLANRLRVARAGIDADAIREVNRRYADNSYLGDVLVDILQKEAYASETEARARADIHAWAARTLGASGNADFLPALEKLKSEATYKKVRKHANKAFKQLRKATKKKR